MEPKAVFISAVRHANGTKYAVAWSSKVQRDALIDRMVAALDSAAYIDETRPLTTEALPTASTSNVAYWSDGARRAGAVTAL